MKTKIILLMILITIFTIFVSQNTNIIPINLLFWRFQISTIVLICLFFLIGLVVGFLISRLYDSKRDKNIEKIED